MASTRQLQAAQTRHFARADRKEKAEIKASASAKVSRAVAEGTLTKPLICDDCGDTDWLRLQTKRVVISGHHPDYGKPLDVEWLCSVCHGEADSLRRKAEKDPNWGHYTPNSLYSDPHLSP